MESSRVTYPPQPMFLSLKRSSAASAPLTLPHSTSVTPCWVTNQKVFTFRKRRPARSSSACYQSQIWRRRMHSNSLGSPTVPSPPCAKQRLPRRASGRQWCSPHLSPLRETALPLCFMTRRGRYSHPLPVDRRSLPALATSWPAYSPARSPAEVMLGRHLPTPARGWKRFSEAHGISGRPEPDNPV